MEIALYYAKIAWRVWLAIFSPLPYGDPWLASAIFFTICFFVAWRLTFSLPHAP